MCKNMKYYVIVNMQLEIEIKLINILAFVYKDYDRFMG